MKCGNCGDPIDDKTHFDAGDAVLCDGCFVKRMQSLARALKGDHRRKAARRAQVGLTMKGRLT